MTHMRFNAHPYTWREMSIPADVRESAMTRLGSILLSWERTPYRGNAYVKQEGVDCVRFGLGVIDELYGTDRLKDVETISDDVCMHDAKAAHATVRQIEELYQPIGRVSDDSIEPGDLIIVGPCGGGPGHLQIVGPRRNTIWHCDRNSGVCYTGMSVRGNYETIFRAYRFQDRVKWAQ